MRNFIFHNPVKILFGKGELTKLATEVPQNAKVLITYGGGSIKKNGVYAQVIAALKDHEIYEFSGIEPNPRYETLMKAVELCYQHNIDYILAVGGGSVIDGSKFIAAAAKFTGEPWDILEKQAPITEAIPLGTVLTLPATGSEMNSASVITHAGKQQKRFFKSPLVLPKFSVLDPTTTLSLPARQIGNGIVDAFTHVMEQYLTYPADAPLQDRMAESILLTLIEEGPKTYHNPTDYNARANTMWCATLALNGLLRCGVPEDWATHMIGHEITALHNLDHAQTLALILPAVMQIKAPQKHDKLLQYADRVWEIKTGNESERIEMAIAKTRNFFESLGVPTKLSVYKLSLEDVANIPARLNAIGLTALGEHQDINDEQVLEILKAAL